MAFWDELLKQAAEEYFHYLWRGALSLHAGGQGHRLHLPPQHRDGTATWLKGWWSSIVFQQTAVFFLVCVLVLLCDDRRENMLEQDRLVVVCGEDDSWRCVLRDRITYSPSSLNRCCSMPCRSSQCLKCVLTVLCWLCVGLYYEWVCCIDEDIWYFHMGVSCSILQTLIDVFFTFNARFVVAI